MRSVPRMGICVVHKNRLSFLKNKKRASPSNLDLRISATRFAYEVVRHSVTFHPLSYKKRAAAVSRQNNNRQIIRHSKEAHSNRANPLSAITHRKFLLLKCRIFDVYSFELEIFRFWLSEKRRRRRKRRSSIFTTPKRKRSAQNRLFACLETAFLPDLRENATR